MRITTNDEFLRWAAERNIRPDTRYPPPCTLQFPQNFGTRRPLFPKGVNSADDLKRSLRMVFDLMPAGPLWIWNRRGSWDFAMIEEAREFRKGFAFEMFDEEVYAAYRQMGIPNGEGALWFEENEHPLATAIVTLNRLMFNNYQDELFVVPRAAHLFLWFDIDDQVFINCADATSLQLVTTKLGTDHAHSIKPGG